MVLNKIIGLFTVDIGQKLKKKIVEKEIWVKNPQKLRHFQKMCLKFEISNLSKFFQNYFLYVNVGKLEVRFEKKF